MGCHSVVWKDAPILEPLWFISLYVQIALCALVAALIGPVRRLMQSNPFAFGVAATFLASAVAFAWRENLPDGVWQNHFKNPWPIAIGIETLPVSLPLACLGWAAASARSTLQKVLVTPLFVLCMVQFPVIQINYFIMVGAAILAVTWDLKVQMPTGLVWAARTLTASTLFVYLAHNGVLHFFKYGLALPALLGPTLSAILAVPTCFAIGLGLQVLFQWTERHVRRHFRRATATTSSIRLSSR